MAESTRADVYIGRNGKPTRAVRRQLLAGFTMHRAIGGWPDGERYVMERSVIVTIVGSRADCESSATILADHAKAKGEQCVMVIWSTPTSVDFR